MVCSSNSFITCSTNTSSSPLNAAYMSPYNLDFKAGSFNLESFLSSFSPLALLGAADCYSDATSQGLTRTSGPCTVASENVGTYPDLLDATTPSIYTNSHPMSVTAEIRNLNQDMLLSSPIAWENSLLRPSFSDWSTSSTVGFSPILSSHSTSLNTATTFKCVSSIARLPSLGEGESRPLL